MKFTDLLFDIVVNEEMKNVGLRNKLKNLWSQQKPDILDSQVEKFYEDFMKQQKGLNLTNPYVVTFLNKFNSPRSSEKFDPKNLQDITKYSYNQIYFLLDDIYGYKERESEDDFGPLFKEKNVRPKDSKNPEDPIISSSKQFWYSNNRFLIVDEGDFRVYAIPDQKTSKVFGYYNEYLSQQVEPYKSYRGTHMQWCTTRSNDSNLWGTYRSTHGRTFYFVIDETKNPEIETDIEKSKFYISALQNDKFLPNGSFRVTNILNDGHDKVYTIDEILKIYPKLDGHFDKFVHVPYDASVELKEETDVVNLISEDPNSRYPFIEQTLRNKKAYIDRGRPLTKPESWESLTDDLKKSYFDITEPRRRPVNERFNSILFVESIISKKQDRNSLIKTLERNEYTFNGLQGLAALMTQLLSTKYDVYLRSKEHNHVLAYEEKATKLVGIFDVNSASWIKIGDYHYKPEYKNKGKIIFLDKTDKNKKIILTKFTLGGQDVDNAFYAVIPDFVKGGNAAATFISPQMLKSFIKENNLEVHKSWASKIKLDEPETPEGEIGYKKSNDDDGDEMTNQTQTQQPVPVN